MHFSRYWALECDVSKSTHKKGHILDFIITWADEDIISECTVKDLFISDHLAVHSSLRLAKLPLERKKVLYRKFRAIDYDEFCDSPQISNLVRDAATLDIVDLVDQHYFGVVGGCLRTSEDCNHHITSCRLLVH